MTHASLFNLGSRIVLANRNVSVSDFHHGQGMLDTLRSPQGGDFHREVSKIAAAAYEADGMSDSMQFHLFTKLAAAKRWESSFERFTLPVFAALGRFANREEELSKRASALAALPFVADKAGVPAVVKMLLGLGAVGGVGAGSLGFLLSRDARETSAENNAITEKTRAYKQLRRDIEEDLAASGALEEKPKTQSRYAI